MLEFMNISTNLTTHALIFCSDKTFGHKKVPNMSTKVPNILRTSICHLSLVLLCSTSKLGSSNILNLNCLRRILPTIKAKLSLKTVKSLLK